MKRVRLITGSPLTTFARETHANGRRARKVWLISPWLSTGPTKDDPIRALIDSLKSRSCTVTVLTRQPTEVWHRDALALLRADLRATIFFCPHLHAKLYLLDCDDFRFAVLGSANLTSRAHTTNLELAMEFRSTSHTHGDDVTQLINDLFRFAIDLSSEDHVVEAVSF
jgi:phosphatidylserine/phosphatidylglycerophosphate/cardiolipin synthase-like enzyme